MRRPARETQRPEENDADQWEFLKARMLDKDIDRADGGQRRTNGHVEIIMHGLEN